MEALDMEAVRSGKVQWGILQQSWPALVFATAYKRLSSILRKGQSSSSKSALATYSTPNQTTIPADPRSSNESDGSQWTISSGDGKTERDTELFANNFVVSSIVAYELYVVDTMSWMNPIYRLLLSPRSVIPNHN